MRGNRRLNVHLDMGSVANRAGQHLFAERVQNRAVDHALCDNKREPSANSIAVGDQTLSGRAPYIGSKPVRASHSRPAGSSCNMHTNRSSSLLESWQRLRGNTRQAMRTYVQGDAAILDQRAHAGQLNVHDRRHVLRAQTLQDNNEIQDDSA